MGLTPVNRHGWRISELREDVGYLDQRGRANHVVGVRRICTELGSYQGLPFRTDVTVLWGFDQQGKLIDLWVWKEQDGL